MALLPKFPIMESALFLILKLIFPEEWNYLANGKKLLGPIYFLKHFSRYYEGDVFQELTVD